MMGYSCAFAFSSLFTFSPSLLTLPTSFPLSLRLPHPQKFAHSLPLLFQREQGLGSVRGLVNLEKKTCFWK